MINKIENLEKAAKGVIEDFDKKPMTLKRKNSLKSLARKFSTYEKLCLELADKSISISLFKPGTRVTFIETREKGTVSSVREKLVFVKFDHLIPDTGMDDMIAQACYPNQLLILREPS